MSAVKSIALVAVGAIGASIAINRLSKPTRTEAITGVMRRQLDEYNSHVQPEQDRRDTIFDRTQIMNDVKAKKPWNMTYAEKERAKHT
jgi:uncharacterized protein YycO